MHRSGAHLGFLAHVWQHRACPALRCWRCGVTGQQALARSSAPQGHPGRCWLVGPSDHAGQRLRRSLPHRSWRLTWLSLRLTAAAAAEGVARLLAIGWQAKRQWLRRAFCIAGAAMAAAAAGTAVRHRQRGWAQHAMSGAELLLQVFSGAHRLGLRC